MVGPAKPWQALQTSDFCAPGESSGPALALFAAKIKPNTAKKVQRLNRNSNTLKFAVTTARSTNFGLGQRGGGSQVFPGSEFKNFLSP
jgi:hypothetical protein